MIDSISTQPESSTQDNTLKSVVESLITCIWTRPVPANTRTCLPPLYQLIRDIVEQGITDGSWARAWISVPRPGYPCRRW